MKSTAVNYLIFWPTGPNWKLERINTPILTSSASRKNLFIQPTNSLISLKKEAHSESPHKMPPMLTPPDPTPSCKSTSKTVKRPFPKSPSLISLETKEAPITWIKTNKLKLMVLKSTNPYWPWRNASEPLIKEKVIPHSEVANLQWF